MSASLKDLKIDLNNLDKFNWKTYRFDEIAKNISERVDPNNTDLKVYIGLEHIDSESLHIKRHGTPDDVNGQKLKFYKGDIIFGRRRAYQRKAGIATWDGFCSAHALVLRANPDVIDPELFPFFMHSDLFMNRAIDISVGSLSPTINWGTLKHQEFQVPPLELQRKLSDLLWRNEQHLQTQLNLKEHLKTTLTVLEVDRFTCRGKDNVKLKEVLSKTLSGGTPDSKNLDFYTDGQVPWITTKILESDFIDVGEKYITEGAIQKSAAKILPEGNIVAGTRVGVGKFSINKIDISFSQDVTGLVVLKDKVDLRFLVHQLNSRPFQQKLKPLCRGTTIKGVTKDDLLNLHIVMPNEKKQIIDRTEIELLKNNISLAEEALSSSKTLQTTIIFKVF